MTLVPRRGQAKRRPLAAKRGRPPKFDVPSRAVTLTLPEHIIAALRAVDADLSRAVAQTVQSAARGVPPLAEVARHGHRAVILVPQNRELGLRTGAELVPVSDGRALILLDRQQSAAQFELRLLDALSDPSLADIDRALFEQIAGILKGSRRAGQLEVLERSLIVMQPRASQARRQRRAGLAG
jgi:hypothetical protein